MSEPVNHHYVSECLIKNFYNNGDRKIYLYDKRVDNHFSRPGTKRIFSQPYDNTSIVDGKISNHIEQELNEHFEKDFPRHYRQILAFVAGDHTLDIIPAVTYMAQLGMIGDLRNTVTKSDMDLSIFKAFEEIFSNATEDLAVEWEHVKDNYQEFKFRTNQGYLDTARDLFERMGEWNFFLIASPPDHYFFLSDCTGYIRKGRINDYFNPDAFDTVEIGIPLNSHLFLLINAEHHQKRESMLIWPSAEKCKALNDNLFKFSKKWLACENGDFLRAYVADRKAAGTI